MADYGASPGAPCPDLQYVSRVFASSSRWDVVNHSMWHGANPPRLCSVGHLRLASTSQVAQPSVQKMIEIGVKFEKDVFEKSPDKVCPRPTSVLRALV